MRCFSDERSRMKVLLADLELENVNLLAAEKKFRHLVDDRDIRLNQEQSAYCIFGLAVSLIGQLKTREAIQLLEHFKPKRMFNQTKTTPRALLNLAICYSMSPDTQEKTLYCYKYIIETFPEAKESDNAFFNIAEGYYYENKKQEAFSWFKEYIKRYPDGNFVSTVQEYLKEFN
jgi:tetratricopeptide (TPR) repeat protein